MPGKLIILDRDGVINHDADNFIKSPDEWLPIPGSLEAMAQLYQAGYRIVIATNQSGIGRKLFNMTALNAIHAKMHRALADLGGHIDAIFFCPHTEHDACLCRKPKPGLLEQISTRLNINITDVPVVGDSLRDLQAAEILRCTPHLVLTGKGLKTQHHPNLPANTHIHTDLQAFATALLKDR
ncbi:MAG: D-glycero-beta-D-manno-heptose 1,7-bisphosphate 7-phosphatase [Ottowia sp.]|nr:D-glycero-beta-D-manno-heptose 1,7-bisphosphate 7-phosphatase [Ottowia sp.]